MPKLSISTKSIQEASGDIIVIPVDTSLDISSFFLKDIAQKVQALLKKVKFQGEWGRAEIFVAPKELSVPFIAVVGMGSADISEEKRAEGIRRAVASVIIRAREHLVRDVCIAIPQLSVLGPVAEAILLTDYWFADYSLRLKQEYSARSLSAVSFFISDAREVKSATSILKRTEYTGAAITLTRNLVNQPASHMSPKILVAEAKKIKKMSSRISLTILDKKQAEKKKFSAFLAVARGSKEQPYVIHLKYMPIRQAPHSAKASRGRQGKKIVFIGKGITFDSGGLSLKPAQSMENMKIDMGGAATVLGLFSLLPTLLPNIEIHGMVVSTISV